jgi:putative Mn2+ efflux pump MntP
MALPHFYALVLFAFLVSVVFGVIARDTLRDRLLYGAKSFGLFVGVAVLIGWIMYFLPH